MPLMCLIDCSWTWKFKFQLYLIVFFIIIGDFTLFVYFEHNLRPRHLQIMIVTLYKS